LKGRKLCTILFDFTTYEQTKLYCFKTDQTFSGFVRSAVRKYLQKQLKQENKSNDSKSKAFA